MITSQLNRGVYFSPPPHLEFAELKIRNDGLASGPARGEVAMRRDPGYVCKSRSQLKMPGIYRSDTHESPPRCKVATSRDMFLAFDLLSEEVAR